MRLAPVVRWSARAAAGLLLAALVVGPAEAGGPSGVMPPNAKMFGQSYAEWSADWFQWSYSMPVDEHPLFDTADPSAGQAGKVWFLGGTFLSTLAAPGEYVGTADRQVTIPTGTALFFPIVNASAAQIEGDGDTEAALRAKAAFLADLIDPDTLFLKVDGKAVRVRDWEDYRVQSPLFEVGPLPDNNISQSFGFDAPAGSTSPVISDGYYVMLNPLSAGKHTIEFGGLLDASDVPGFGFTFRLDIKYAVTVAAPKKR